MNERIRELYEQAHDTVTKQVRKGGWDNDREPFEYHTVIETAFSPEKFAELIVRECAEWVDHNLGLVDEEAKADLLKHFGVEE